MDWSYPGYLAVVLPGRRRYLAVVLAAVLGLAEPVHDAFHVAQGAADPLELLRDGGIGVRAGRQVPIFGAVAHHGDGVVEVQARRARLAGFLHPDDDLLHRPVQRLADLGDGTEVAEQQPRRLQRGEPAHGGQGGVQVEVGRRRGRPDVPGFRQVHACRIPDVQVAGVGVDEADVVLGVAGRVVAVQVPAAAEIDGADV